MLDILVILDRSGSMQQARSDHEGGLRSFVAEQQQLEGEVRFTFIRFDSHNPCEIVYDRAPIASVQEDKLTLVPRGDTPLLDAMGKAMAHIAGEQRVTKADRTVCMVITDGQENASHEWTYDRIRARVTELEAAGWVFLFLGANIDSFGQSAPLGVAAAMAMNYDADAQGVQAMYASTSENLCSARSASSGLIGANLAKNLEYTPLQRARASKRTATVTHAVQTGGSSGVVPGSGHSAADEKAKR